MSDVSQGAGWWQASDGKWYPAESHPDATAVAAPVPTPPVPPAPTAAPSVSPLAGSALEARVNETMKRLNPIGLIILGAWVAFMVLLAFVGFTT
jgi:hypothetical protein